MVESEACQPLTSLIRWEAPLGELIGAANRCDQQNGPSVLLDRDAAKAILRRCISGQVHVEELSRWAGAVHMLERIEITGDDLDLLTQFLFEVSSPELFDPITVDLCQRWLDRMEEV